MIKIKFTKVHGTGNDFVLVEKDDLKGADPSEFAIESSKRHFGAGSDGLLVVENSEKCDVLMRMYNPDGSEAMCGNGIRCFGKYVYERGIAAKKNIVVETIAGEKKLELEVSDDNIVVSVRADMGKPIFERKLIPVAEKTGPVPIIGKKIEAGGRIFDVVVLSMGNPHAVIFVNKLNKDDVLKYGKVIESHPFFPERVNVEFVEVVSEKLIKMNVYERGAGFTLSCGTGTCAAAVAAHLEKFINDTVTIEVPGGVLQIEYKYGGNVFMTGPAEIVYEGEYYFNG